MCFLRASTMVLCRESIASDDPVEQRDALFNERALLHVAATRAVKGLFVSSYGVPSTLLTVE